MDTLFQSLLGAIASGTVIAAILSVMFFRRNKKIEHELEKIKVLFLSPNASGRKSPCLSY